MGEDWQILSPSLICALNSPTAVICWEEFFKIHSPFTFFTSTNNKKKTKIKKRKNLENFFILIIIRSQKKEKIKNHLNHYLIYFYFFPSVSSNAFFIAISIINKANPQPTVGITSPIKNSIFVVSKARLSNSSDQAPFSGITGKERPP